MLPYGVQHTPAHGPQLYAQSLSRADTNNTLSETYAYPQWPTTSPTAQVVPTPVIQHTDSLSLEAAYSAPQSTYYSLSGSPPLSSSSPAPIQSSEQNTSYDPRDRYGYYQQHSFGSSESLAQPSYQYYDSHAAATLHQHGPSLPAITSSSTSQQHYQPSYETIQQYQQDVSQQYAQSGYLPPTTQRHSTSSPSTTAVPSVQRQSRNFAPSTQPIRPSSLRQVSNFDQEAAERPMRTGSLQTKRSHAGSVAESPRLPESLPFAMMPSSSPVYDRQPYSPTASTTTARFDSSSSFQSSAPVFDLVSAAQRPEALSERHSANSLNTNSQTSATHPQAMDILYRSDLLVPLTAAQTGRYPSTGWNERLATSGDSPSGLQTATPGTNIISKVDQRAIGTLHEPPSTSADLTGSTLTDQEYFATPAESRTPHEDDVTMSVDAPDLTATTHATALTAALVKVLDSAQGDSLSVPPLHTLPATKKVPGVTLTRPAAALSQPSSQTASPLVNSDQQLPPAPFNAIHKTSPTKRGGYKRKRGSAGSSPARSRLATPLPTAFIAPKVRIRCRFPTAGIAFHIGKCVEEPVEPKKKSGRAKQFTLLDGVNDRERDRDLFKMRGRVLETNGSRTRGSNTLEQGSRTRPKGTPASSRAASVAASSSPKLAPQTRLTRQANKPATSGTTTPTGTPKKNQPAAVLGPKTSKQKGPIQPLFTTVPLPVSQERSGTDGPPLRKRKRDTQDVGDSTPPKRAKQSNLLSPPVRDGMLPSSPLTELTDAASSPLSELSPQPDDMFEPADALPEGGIKQEHTSVLLPAPLSFEAENIAKVLNIIRLRTRPHLWHILMPRPRPRSHMRRHHIKRMCLNQDTTSNTMPSNNRHPFTQCHTILRDTITVAIPSTLHPSRLLQVHRCLVHHPSLNHHPNHHSRHRRKDHQDQDISQRIQRTRRLRSRLILR
ncbi:hypothetical protein BKA62DRAFT_1060 [Auriculariales sp. MPI-PUGE-AT-0066]|nr:hypothetical protein BKA62DRAFT_1060 [Auriculariales sp. MPI-PUGE-AT-0066]